MRQTLDLASLQCFVTAARLNSFREAARACHLSPSAFGERIRRLEDQLATQLFQRTTRSVSLSPTGQRLLLAAQKALEAADACYDAIEVAPEFSLTIGTRFELGMSWLVPQLDGLSKLTPRRTLHVSFGDSPELLRAIRRGEIDAAVTSSRQAVSGFDYALLHEEHYRFVAARTLLAKASFDTPRDAANHRLLDTSEELPLFRYLLDSGSTKALWKFRSTTHLGTIAAIRMRVLEGHGVAVLPEYFVRRDIAKGHLKVLLPTRKIPSDWFRLVWKVGHPRRQQLEELAQQLLQYPLR